MFTCSPQDKIIVEFIKMTRSKVYIPLIPNTVLFPEWSTAVCLFSDCCSRVPCVSWTVQLSAVLQKNPSAHTYSLVLQDFCVFEPFPTMTVRFLDPSFHTEDNWGTHLHLLQKIQTLTDAPEEKTCIKSRGVKTFEQNEDVYIFLVLPKYNIFFI